MSSTKELSIEKLERILKLIQEGNEHWGVEKDSGCSYQLNLKFGAKRIGWFKRKRR